jgi:hypothetical protein
LNHLAIWVSWATQADFPEQGVTSQEYRAATAQALAKSVRRLLVRFRLPALKLAGRSQQGLATR